MLKQTHIAQARLTPQSLLAVLLGQQLNQMVHVYSLDLAIRQAQPIQSRLQAILLELAMRLSLRTAQPGQQLNQMVHVYSLDLASLQVRLIQSRHRAILQDLPIQSRLQAILLEQAMQVRL